MCVACVLSQVLLHMLHVLLQVLLHVLFACVLLHVCCVLLQVLLGGHVCCYICVVGGLRHCCWLVANSIVAVDVGVVSSCSSVIV